LYAATLAVYRELSRGFRFCINAANIKERISHLAESEPLPWKMLLQLRRVGAPLAAPQAWATEHE